MIGRAATVRMRPRRGLGTLDCSGDYWTQRGNIGTSNCAPGDQACMNAAMAAINTFNAEWEACVQAPMGQATTSAYQTLQAKTGDPYAQAYNAQLSSIQAQGGTSAAGGSGAPSGVSTTPAAQHYAPSILFTTSRGGTTLQPGDTWTMRITGGQPNAAVTVTGSAGGTSFGSTQMGSTDAYGTFSASNVVPNQPGPWSETWAVAGQMAGSVAFTIVAPSAASPNPPAPPPPQVVNPSPSTQPVNTGTATTSATSAVSTANGGFLSDLQTGTDIISGIPNWLLLGGGAALLMFMFTRHGR